MTTIKVIATKKGFYNDRVIMPGEVFDALWVSSQTSSSWFEPVRVSRETVSTSIPKKKVKVQGSIEVVKNAD